MKTYIGCNLIAISGVLLGANGNSADPNIVIHLLGLTLVAFGAWLLIENQKED